MAWSRRPLFRVLGSFASWLLFSLCMSLLALGFLDLVAIGTCASGGPFVIENECPSTFETISGFMTLSVFGGLIAVAIAAIFARGFGTSLLDLAWPTLFCGMSAGFFLLYAVGADGVFLPLGILMAVIGLVPLAVALWASPQRVFAGAVNLRGQRFAERAVVRNSPFSVRYGRSDETVPARLADWAISLGIWLAAVAIGAGVPALVLLAGVIGRLLASLA